MAQAYDFALDKMGMDIMSYQIWMDYINFLKSVYVETILCILNSIYTCIPTSVSMTLCQLIIMNFFKERIIRIDCKYYVFLLEVL